MYPSEIEQSGCGSQSICVMWNLCPIDSRVPHTTPVLLPKPDHTSLSIADTRLTLPAGLSIPMTSQPGAYSFSTAMPSPHPAFSLHHMSTSLSSPVLNLFSRLEFCTHFERLGAQVWGALNRRKGHERRQRIRGQGEGGG